MGWKCRKISSTANIYRSNYCSFEKGRVKAPGTGHHNAAIDECERIKSGVS